MAEGFSRLGVPVFMADIKGDLKGVSQTGNIQAKMAEILRSRDIDCPTPRAFPVTLWDVFGDKGHPVRATISDLGCCCCRACSTLTTHKPVCCS